MKTNLIFLIFISIMCSTAFAKSPITILRGQDFPPYHFLEKSGEPTGFIIEIIQAVADEINIEIQFEQYPWSRCLRMMEAGKADAMMNLFMTEKRKKFLYFSNNILVYEINQFFKRKQTLIQFHGDLSTLLDSRIGAIRNYSYGSDFDSLDFKNVFRLETETTLIKALLNKRCDLIIGNDVVIRMLINKMGVGNTVEPVFPIVSKEPLYIGFSKILGHKKLSENFSEALHRFRNNSAYENLLKRYQQ